MKIYKSGKKFGHEVGLSCAFRQWRASHSHCKFVHGYAMAVELEFGAVELDERNWVVDFGSLNTFKENLRNLFDHKTIIAEDDPMLDYFREGHEKGVLDLVVLPAVGCEKFAEHVYKMAEEWLDQPKLSGRVWVESVTVREHGANSASYSLIDAK